MGAPGRGIPLTAGAAIMPEVRLEAEDPKLLRSGLPVMELRRGAELFILAAASAHRRSWRSTVVWWW